MNFSPEDFVTAYDILADVLLTVRDKDMKRNTEGWYKSQIQQALQELSFDTFFSDVHKTFEMPCDLQMNIPKGAFNIRQVYAHNGTNCDFGSATNVYFKRNRINSKGGRDYLARDRWGNNGDSFHLNRSHIEHEPSRVHHVGIQGGVLMFSQNCASFSHVTLVYSGVQTDIGVVPVVPIYLRQAVKSKVSVEALTVAMADAIGTQEYNQWASLRNTINEQLMHPYDGEWVKAERRSKTLDSKQREDIKMYFQRMNY
jgi:hypothetical protein